MTDGILLPVIAILFGATLVRASLGFGEALISVPLLALLMPVDQAAPIAVLVSITIALIILVRDWRDVHFRSAWRLIVSTLFGTPLGLLLLTTVPEVIVKTILAVVILAFSLHALLAKQRYEISHDRFAWPFGFLAGILGGAYGMNGPPLAVYGALRRWRPEHFRATLQAYFLPASIAGMAGYFLAGLWTPAVNHFYLASLPVVVVASLGGSWIGRRLQPGRFTLYVHGALVVIGVVLLFQALTAAAPSL
jgi:uncharacterized membrane protein YfcA